MLFRVIVRKNSPLPFIYLVIYISIGSCIFYTLGYNPILDYFVAQFSIFSHKEFFYTGWHQCPFDIPYPFIFLKCFLTFWHYKILKVHVLISLPQPLNQPLPQEVLVPFTGEWY